MIKIRFGTTNFNLQSDGSIYWPQHNTIILADLHLEKASFYAHHNIANIPPYDSLDTIKKLYKKLEILPIKKIILLGDIFHDDYGLKRMQKVTKSMLQKLCINYEVIWIVGNHDGLSAPKEANICNDYSLDKIYFTHYSKTNSSLEISGHYHPKAKFQINGKNFSKPCFLISKKKIILPSYGTFTGGMTAQSKIFKDIFQSNFNKYAISNDKVFLVN